MLLTTGSNQAGGARSMVAMATHAANDKPILNRPRERAPTAMGPPKRIIAISRTRTIRTMQATYSDEKTRVQIIMKDNVCCIDVSSSRRLRGE